MPQGILNRSSFFLCDSVKDFCSLQRKSLQSIDRPTLIDVESKLIVQQTKTMEGRTSLLKNAFFFRRLTNGQNLQGLFIIQAWLNN